MRDKQKKVRFFIRTEGLYEKKRMLKYLKFRVMFNSAHEEIYAQQQVKQSLGEEG